MQVLETHDYKLYNLGMFAPSFVILDDEADTVEEYKAFLLDNHISTLITNKCEVALSAFSEQGNRSAYAFDNHMRGIGKIGKRGTFQGLAVGLAVISEITDDGKGKNINHCATISAYSTDADARSIYGILEENGQRIDIIDKSDFSHFERFVDRYKSDYYNHIEFDMVRSNTLAAEAALMALSAGGDAEAEVGAIVGYPRGDILKWRGSRDSILRLAGADFKERIEALAYIIQGMALHFESNLEDQRDWVHTKRDELHGKSVWGVLTSGDYSDIQTAASFVNRVLG